MLRMAGEQEVTVQVRNLRGGQKVAWLLILCWSFQVLLGHTQLPGWMSSQETRSEKKPMLPADFTVPELHLS